ncbi:hypothetical protein CCACVL1_28069 [Corchorus capsularis]|uniref:RRM domain-containing protein n=1 Tax=Corchorus capsularis TaxID=210143 RepID=A0A1R3G7T6_COCAP|nr:hypothetical protein CCACVL1_28069 [Corchorus capsularis]
MSGGVSMDESNRTLLVTVSDVQFPVTDEVLNHIFSPYGTLEKITILPEAATVGFQALVEFQQHHSAAAAKNSLHGRDIYDDCCRLDIKFSQPPPPEDFDQTFDRFQLHLKACLAAIQEDSVEPKLKNGDSKLNAGSGWKHDLQKLMSELDKKIDAKLESKLKELRAEMRMEFKKMLVESFPLREDDDKGNCPLPDSNLGFSDLEYHRPRLECPKFNGDDFKGWYLKLKQYFEVENVPEDSKVFVAMMSMEGDALNWHIFYTRNQGGSIKNLTWPLYKEALLERYAPDPMSELLQLKQTTTVEQYNDEFLGTLLLLDDMSECLARAIFVENLKPEISQILKFFRPQKLDHAFLLARRIEYMINMELGYESIIMNLRLYHLTLQNH